MKKVKDIDRGFNRIKIEMSKQKVAYTQVGIQSGEMTIESTSLAEIAAYNEYGTEHIPSRPFMRNSFDENQSKAQALVNSQYNAVLAGKKSLKNGLGLIGAWFQDIIQKEITSLDSPPNAPSTIKRKGSSNPLIDTGRMRQSIRHIEVFK